MKIIDNPFQVVKHISTWALSAVAVFQTAWFTTPELHVLVSDETASKITAGLAVVGIVGKLINQGASK